MKVVKEKQLKSMLGKINLGSTSGSVCACGCGVCAC